MVQLIKSVLAKFQTSMIYITIGINILCRNLILNKIEIQPISEFQIPVQKTFLPVRYKRQKFSLTEVNLDQFDVEN